MARNRATINVSQEAKAQLDTLKSPGQSYDGVIRELVKFRKEKEKKGSF